MNSFVVSRYGVRGCYRHLCYLASLLDRCERQASPQNRKQDPLFPSHTLQGRNIENLKQIFPEKEYRCLSPNFHIHVSDPTIGLPILLQENTYVDRSWEYINRSQTHECGNWDCCRAIPFLGIHKWDFRCSVGR